MGCILYHINGNYLGSDNGLVVMPEKVLVLFYLRVKNHDVGNLLSSGSASCVYVIIFLLPVYLSIYHLSSF